MGTAEHAACHGQTARRQQCVGISRASGARSSWIAV